MSPISFVSSQRELELVNGLLIISTTNSNDSNGFKRDLILSGYTKDKSIIELLIRTSLSIGQLHERLLYLGFNININHIQLTESNLVCVPLPIDAEVEYLMIYGTLMQKDH